MDQQNNNTNSKKFVLSIAGLATLGLVGYMSNIHLKPNTTEMKVVNNASNVEMPQETISTKYKNGTYTVVGEYVSPGGPEQVEITLVIEDDKVLNASGVSKATLPTSINFQGQFLGGFKDVILGKNIDEIKVDKVAGSSLTPKGFHDALEKIKLEAQS